MQSVIGKWGRGEVPPTSLRIIVLVYARMQASVFPYRRADQLASVNEDYLRALLDPGNRTFSTLHLSLSRDGR